MKSYKFEYETELTTRLDNIGTRKFDEKNILEMTLWKLSRYPHIDNNVLKKINSLASIAEIEGNKNQKKVCDTLRVLLQCKGVRLPMASTYLRFRNPSVFQIIDQRVWHQLYDSEYENSYNYDVQIAKYLKYLHDLRNLCQKDGVPFEIADRYYYLKDIEENHHIHY